MPQIGRAGKIGHFMDDDFRFRCSHRRANGLRIEAVGDDGSAPIRLMASVFAALRVSPTTEWPAATSAESSGRPTAPVAPATRIRMMESSSSLLLRRQVGQSNLNSSKHGWPFSELTDRAGFRRHGIGVSATKKARYPRASSEDVV